MAIDLIRHNPLMKKPLIAVLAVCAQNPGIGRAALDAEARSRFGAAFSRYAPLDMVDVLVRNGALAEEVLVDGRPYAGTLEDVSTDASVEEGAAVESRLSITAAGEELAGEYAAARQLEALFADRPAYAGIYRSMLAACCAPDGCTRAQLEAVIDADPLLQEGSREGGQRIYPQYFIDALECAGGIAWDGAWRTTAEGRSFQ